MSYPTSVRAPRLLALALAAPVLFLPVGSWAQTAPSAPPARAVQPPAVRPRPAPAVAAQPPVAQPAQAPAAPAPAMTTAKASASADDVVARVGGADISAGDVRAYVGALGPREQAALAKDPALLSQAVRLLLANRLVLQEIAAKKWDQQPDVAAQLERVKQNALVELYLQTVSMPPENFPSEDELQKVYDANRAALLVPRQFQLAQIFVAVASDADKAAQDKAKQSLDELQRKLKAPGADFTAVAKTENDGKDGGDLGWLPESQIRPEIRAQVMGLAKNAISEPVRLEDGWHILKLIDTKASYTRTLPEVREQLVQQIRAERATMLRRAYIAELLKQHPPILNELALSNLFDNSKK